MTQNKISKRVKSLESLLIGALDSPYLDYQATKQIKSSGVYFIFYQQEIIYIGKTNRTGKLRLRELAADYRSHTLNRKLLRELLSKVLQRDLPPLKKSSKKELIESGIISEIKFSFLQNTINNRIKKDMQFKFIDLPANEVLALEHFAIAVLEPKMND